MVCVEISDIGHVLRGGGVDFADRCVAEGVDFYGDWRGNFDEYIVTTEVVIVLYDTGQLTVGGVVHYAVHQRDQSSTIGTGAGSTQLLLCFIKCLFKLFQWFQQSGFQSIGRNFSPVQGVCDLRNAGVYRGGCRADLS